MNGNTTNFYFFPSFSYQWTVYYITGYGCLAPLSRFFFFSTKLATLSSKSKDWLAQNQDKVLKEIFFRSSINLNNPSVLLFVCFGVFSAKRSNDRTINSYFKMHFICGEPIFMGFIGQSSKYKLFHKKNNWDLSI